jgi:hypothetical protein
MKDLWRKTCINFNDDIKWLVSEVNIAPHREICKVNYKDDNRFLVRALWDTGSTTTIISPEISYALNLSNLGNESMETLVGFGQVSTYVVDLFLDDKIVLQKLKVVEMPCRNQYFDMIIGLDIIKLGNFSITRNKDNFSMNFDLPAPNQVKVQNK